MTSELTSSLAADAIGLDNLQNAEENTSATEAALMNGSIITDQNILQKRKDLLQDLFSKVDSFSNDDLLLNFVVFQHGIQGFKRDWQVYEQFFKFEAQDVKLFTSSAPKDQENEEEMQKLGEKYKALKNLYHIYNCGENEFLRSTEGLEICGIRSVLELLLEWKTNFAPKIKEKMEKNEKNGTKSKTFRFLMIGHSLGGLIAREIVANLFSDAGRSKMKKIIEAKKLPKNFTISDSKRIDFKKIFPEDIDLFFENCQPHLFMTLSTPHLGVRKVGGSLKKNVWRTLVNSACNYMLGKSGKELYLLDKAQKLKKMASDQNLKALTLFSHRILTATAHHDMSVPFPTASIRSKNPYHQFECQTLSPLPKFHVAGAFGLFDNKNNATKHKNSSNVDELFEKLFEIAQLEQPNEQIQLNDSFDKEGTEYFSLIGGDKPKDPEIESEIENASLLIPKNQKTGWVFDNNLHTQIDKEMLESFQTTEGLQFKRVDFNLKLSFSNKLMAHVFPICKILPILPNHSEGVKESKKNCEFIFKLILIQSLEGYLTTSV